MLTRVESVWEHGIKKSICNRWQLFNDRWRISDPDKATVWKNFISKERMKEIQALFANTVTKEDRENLMKQASEEEREFFEDANNDIEIWLERVKRAALKDE